MEVQYKSVKRWSEVYSTTMFANNIQIWLSIFAFSTFIVSFLYPHWDKWRKLTTLSLAEQVGFFLSSVVGVVFIVVAILAFISLGVLVWRAIFGQKIKYDLRRTPSEFLDGLSPANKDRVLRAKEGQNGEVFEARMNKTKMLNDIRVLISQNNALIARYLDTVISLEVKQSVTDAGDKPEWA
ncbi:MAG: hypothetical protein ABIB93_03735 [Chloroflexota bacterium]